MFHCIKQLEEKAVATEIDALIWSDRMDLVALSNNKGEVALHRLTWARAVSLGPYKEGITVKGLAWKPDGKIIAVGYSTSRIILMNVENKGIINNLDVNGEISYMYWVKEKNHNKSSKITSDQEEQKNYLKYLDYSATFLPDPPPLSNFGSSNTTEENININCHKQSELNMLVIGTMDGFIYISIFGCSPWIIFNLSQHLGYHCSILSILFSEELNLLYATVKDQYGNIKIAIVNTSIFKSHTKELFAVSMKHEYLNALLNYLSSTISIIKETWENILLEMDAKLSKYAAKVPEGTLATDFLDLLMFGITTEHMQEFLLHDLTKKGLEKFGQTIEMSYANIQKLLLKNVTKVGQNVTYHLAELRGMARLEYRYKVKKFLKSHGLPPRAILLLDNAPSHPPKENLRTADGMIFVIFMPPNVTPLIQPLDQNVLKLTKLYYRKSLLSSIVGKSGQLTESLKLLTIRDAIMHLTIAWNKLNPDIIRKCWNNILKCNEPDEDDIPLSAIVKQINAAKEIDYNEALKDTVTLLNEINYGNTSEDIEIWNEDRQDGSDIEIFDDEIPEDEEAELDPQRVSHAAAAKDLGLAVQWAQENNLDMSKNLLLQNILEEAVLLNIQSRKIQKKITHFFRPKINM